jgi:hypothetical protein
MDARPADPTDAATATDAAPSPAADAVAAGLDPSLQGKVSTAALEAAARFAARRTHSQRAAAAILPGPLRQAFHLGLPPGNVRPVTLADLALLAAWEHPLAAWLEGWLAGEEVGDPELTLADQRLLCLLFGVRAAEAMRHARQSGRSLFEGGRSQVSNTMTAADWARHVTDGFAPALGLKPPAEKGVLTLANAGDEDGTGWWLAMLTFLIVQCHLALDDALCLPIAQGVALQQRVRLASGYVLTSAGYLEQEETRLAASDL